MTAGNLVTPHWYCDNFPRLINRSWGEEVFVFNPLTGHTHILNQLAWELLTDCGEKPRTLECLLGSMGESSGDMTSEECEISLRDHLEQLLQLDLIRVNNHPCS